MKKTRDYQPQRANQVPAPAGNFNWTMSKLPEGASSTEHVDIVQYERVNNHRNTNIEG